jgi:hypothetical protein
LNEAVLDRDKRRVIQLQAHLAHAGRFFLAGGTGLGLHLGHRLSEDLDWFTPARFDAKELMKSISLLPEKPTLLRQDGRHTVRAYYNELETSFIAYDQVPARIHPLTVGAARIAVADVELLAAMKAAVLHDRGARRDFIDVHAISRMNGWSVARFIEHGARALPLQPTQIARSATYFVDAEKDPMPRGCTVSWEVVKADLTKGVRAWERSRDRGLDR